MKSKRKDTGSGPKPRNSSIELLRIFSIFGILLLHTFSSYYGMAIGFNLKYGLVVNSVFNASVTVFFLISGYYGINSSKEKIIRLWLIVVFYSIIYTCANVYFNHLEIDFSLIIKTLMPVTNGDYWIFWFMRTYIIISIFAKYINKLLDSIKKQDFKIIILFLVMIFNIIPTITGYQFLGDGGKGIINMIIVYTIGRYIHYYIKDVSRLKVVFIGLITLIIELLLNANATAKAGFVGVKAPYAYDYSIFILVIGICIFLFFKTFNFNNKIINKVAKSILSIHLLDISIRLIVPFYINLSYAAINDYLPICLIGYAILIFIIGFIFDLLRNLFFGRLEQFLTKIIIKMYEKISNFICREGKHQKVNN